MRLKTTFAVAALAAATILFVYCSKENPVAQNIPAKELSSRGPCTITLTPTNGVNICGTQTSAAVCAVVGGVDVLGTDFIAPNGTQTYTITPPCVLLVSRNPNFLDTDLVTVHAETGNGKEEYNVPFTGTVQINVDANCTPF